MVHLLQIQLHLEVLAEVMLVPVEVMEVVVEITLATLVAAAEELEVILETEAEVVHEDKMTGPQDQAAVAEEDLQVRMFAIMVHPIQHLAVVEEV
jgi:hypothetical protein